jgi:hypothetical protein
MLSSRNRRFFWAKSDRVEDPPLFRSLAQRWRPLIPRTRVAERDEQTHTQQTTRTSGGEQTAARWTPWLWTR